MNPAIEFFQPRDSTTYDEVVFTFHLFGADLFSLYIREANAGGNVSDNGYFFTDGIYKVKTCLGKKNRQRNSGKTATCANVEDTCPCLERRHPGDTERVQNMIDVKVIDVLPRYDVYLRIPFLAQRQEAGKLLFLKVSKVGEIRKYQL